MQRPKLLLPWLEGTVIEAVLAAWRESKVDCVFVVVHPGDNELAEICRRSDAQTIVAETPPPQMKDSVTLALREIAADERPSGLDAWLLAPADMPTLSAETINLLLSAQDAKRPRILVPSHDGRRGHPVLFPWPLADEVFQLNADEGVNVLLGRHPLQEIVCPPGEMAQDIDTPRQYRQMKRRYQSSS